MNPVFSPWLINSLKKKRVYIDLTTNRSPLFSGVELCKDPGTVNSASRFSSSSKFLLGSWISFECNEGYYMAGESKIFCQSSGKWSAELPRCVPILIVETQSERTQSKMETQGKMEILLVLLFYKMKLYHCYRTLNEWNAFMVHFERNLLQ